MVGYQVPCIIVIRFVIEKCKSKVSKFDILDMSTSFAVGPVVLAKLTKTVHVENVQIPLQINEFRLILSSHLL